MLKVILFFASLALAAHASDVVVLTSENFEDETKAIEGGGGDWLVKFYAPWCGHCKKMAPTWEDVATELKGEVKVAKVDCTEGSNQRLGSRFGVRGFPTVKFFHDGQVYNYKGARSKEALTSFAREGFRSAEGEKVPPVSSGATPPKQESPEVPEHSGPTDVVTLTSDNFEHLTQASTGATTGDWLVEFYAPWCGHCKKLQPIWEEVATELKDVVNVAKVDVTAHRTLGSRFGIKGYPTIKFFHKGEMFAYKGGRSKDALTEFARSGYQSHSGEPVPKPVTWFETKKKQLVNRMIAAEKDISKGKYWTPNVVFFIASAAAVVFVLVVLTIVIVATMSNKPTPKPKIAKKED